MKLKKLSLKILMVIAIGFVVVSCEQENSFIEEHPELESDITERAPWQTIFYEPFNNLSKWQKTNRADYNSATCRYKPQNVGIVNIGNNNKALRLVAKKLGNNDFKSGHVKSWRQFKPGWNEEIRFVSRIKLQARKGNGEKVAFHKTYGAWPAFWTVNETNWPTKGEIDIMEAYTYGALYKDDYKSNIFFGNNVGNNDLSNTAKEYTNKINRDTWNKYEMRWRNKNGNRVVVIYINNKWVKAYTVSNTPGLKLQNFTPHNIILNLNVGSNSNLGIFNNSKVKLFDQTEMLVDWVKVEKRAL